MLKEVLLHAQRTISWHWSLWSICTYLMWHRNGCPHTSIAVYLTCIYCNSLRCWSIRFAHVLILSLCSKLLWGKLSKCALMCRTMELVSTRTKLTVQISTTTAAEKKTKKTKQNKKLHKGICKILEKKLKIYGQCVQFLIIL